MTQNIKIGVSSCLLGEAVRYDGGHKRSRYLTDTLSAFFSFVPVCPEVECGLPVPREAMRLEGDPAAPRLMTIRSRNDLTEQMQAFCRRRVDELEQEQLCGFVFKKNSPSSGLFRVKVYQQGVPARTGRGLFARAVTERFPLLPVVEEERLNDPQLRENFLERVFAYQRWQRFLREDGTVGGLVAFHTRHKLQLMSHHPRQYRAMGQLVATAGETDRQGLLVSYEELFMTTLASPATPAKQTDVLMHIMGYFKKQLTAGEKTELLELIDRYRRQLLPLIVPVTLLIHYVRKYAQPYLLEQTYLAPHPAELMLRNHV